MMNENYNTPNSGCCGRPFPTAPANKCNYNNCCMNEYRYKMPACIRNKQPDCEAQAVIPSITVETADGITNLANCLVHVTSTNTTYYVDDKHRIMITWAGPVNIPGYDMENNPNKYKDQIVTDTENETAVIYDNHGKGYLFGITSENLQEAVNNKLDEMAEDGTLTEIIGDYIEVAKKSYLISEITSEKIYVDNNKGDVFVTRIPHVDTKGNVIQAKHGFANDAIDTGTEIPTEFSNRNKCTLVINASIGATESQVSANIQQGELLGLYIHDGEVVKDNRQYLTSSFLTNRWILGFTSDGLMKTYIGTTDSSTILNDGVIETYQAFVPLMVEGAYYKPTLQSLGVTYWPDNTFTPTSDGSPIYSKIYYTLSDNVPTGHFHLSSFASGVTYYEEVATNDKRYARQIICQDANKNIIIITNNGKGKIENQGLTLNDFYTLAKYYQATFAFVLDGGGSTCTVFNNIMLNNPTDNQGGLTAYTTGLGYSIREVPDFIYFSDEVKTEYDVNINNIYSHIQELNKKINDNLMTSEDEFKSVTEFYDNENQQHRFEFKQWNSTDQEFEKTMEIYFNNSTSYPGGINIVDVANGIEVMRIHNNLNQGIRYLGKMLAMFTNDIPTSTDTTLDLDNLSPTATVLRLHTNLNLTNQPFTTSDGGIYWLFQWGDTRYTFQFALACKSLPLLRVRAKTDDGWKLWRNIAVTSMS